MKSDLKLVYATKCDQIIQVESNIEGIELKSCEMNEKIDSKPATFLLVDDIDELIQMLYAAKDHYGKKS